MKKILLTAVAVFAFSFANAQDTKYGVKGGLNMSNNSSEGSKSITSFHLGVFAQFKMNDKFAIQPELLYSGQGASTDLGTVNLNYLNIPVMAKYNVADAFSIEAGPQIGFLMSAKFGSLDFKDQCNSTDFGFNLGAGYDLNETMSLGLRYTMGLSNVEKDVAGQSNNSKNSNIQLSFGYKF
ncbi:MAG: porin family protein [Flavobacteriaceae bacterium]|jgi:long-subunit fatty acid transport protein|nr:porin family protein [Flavobacteriaceae bacterium]